MPPPLTHGPEPLEAGVILDEMENPLGSILWLAVRDVTLWAATPPTARDTLFRETAGGRRRNATAAAAPDPLVQESLDTISTLLDGEAADRTIAAACAQIARWADASSHSGVALAFGQAVALILPEDAECAFTVADLARKHGETSRADSWYRRAVMLARRTGAWGAYAKAFLALGELHGARGDSAAAQRFFGRAERVAKRYSLHALAESARRGRSDRGASSREGFSPRS